MYLDKKTRGVRKGLFRIHDHDIVVEIKATKIIGSHVFHGVDCNGPELFWVCSKDLVELHTESAAA